MLESLVELTPGTPDIALDMRLANNNNFTGQTIYQRPAAILHRDALACLETARKVVRSLGLKLHIWDAFRPLEAQAMLWQHTPDARYVSPPQDGSRPHCRGIAIDLTLAKTDGSLLDMGTEFDDFRPLAHHNNTSVSSEVLGNRLLLAGLMHTAGFEAYAYEWWHYQLPGLEQYPVLNDRMAGTNLIR